jgi:hypothetical protein
MKDTVPVVLKNEAAHRDAAKLTQNISLKVPIFFYGLPQVTVFNKRYSKPYR